VFDEQGMLIKRDPKLGVFAVALWVMTSVVSFLEILTARVIVIRIYSYFAITYGFYDRETRGAQAVGVVALVIMGIVCIAVAIGCGEYHLKHFGQPQSWKLFSRTIAFEVAIFALASLL
jgi:hypothetical protein